MSLLDRTKEICKLYDIWPSRSKGQNFLTNENVYDRIVAAAELSKDDVVLEVGPGLGFLTSRLAKESGRVLAVEMDDKLAAYLNDAFTVSDIENVEVVNVDVLKFNPFDAKYQIQNTKYKIVANLPYNITSFFLRTVFTSWPRPKEIVLLLQKEVVERICAKPGDMSLLALSIQYHAEVENLFNVPRSDFWPSPEVDSAVIRIRTKQKSAGDDEERAMFRLAKIGFSAKRKMLKNNLAGGLKMSPSETENLLVSAGLPAKARAEDLSVDDWLRLASLQK
jgi:16S rRNA (adenine1518-N6/adenine1519-N6)-dimethyltransferase